MWPARSRSRSQWLTRVCISFSDGHTVPSSRTAISLFARCTFSSPMKACNSGSTGRFTNLSFVRVL